MRWAERKDDDDNLRQQIKLLKLVRLQAWARGMSAISLLNRLRLEQEKNLELVRLAAIKITSVCRQRLAFKEFRRRSRQKR
ncbi:hypothetical protein EON65_02945 [archaeon]|nr:MAG: hypothetical protein EON65_02945 [archaeon]